MRQAISGRPTAWRDVYDRARWVAVVAAAAAHAAAFFFLPSGIADRLHEALIPSPTLVFRAGGPGSELEVLALRAPSAAEPVPVLPEPEKVEAVAGAISDHMGLWRDEPLTILESQVLWDADKLAKIGLTAIFHWTGGWLAGGKMRTLEEIIERGRNAEWLAKTVASMHTEPARRAAEARFAAYRQLYDALERELVGGDLAR